MPATSSSSPRPSPGEGNTGYAQGGIAAAVGADDSPDLHAADTIAAGDGLCDEAAVRVLVRGRPAVRARADRVGRALRSRRRRQPALGHRGRAQRAARAARARCHRPRNRPRPVGARVRGFAASGPIDHARRHRAGRSSADRCAGARFLGDGRHRARSAEPASCCSRPAARGRSSARPPIPPWRPATALPWRTARAPRSPTSSSSSFTRPRSSVPGAPRFLLSEALRGEGARLVNADGEAFMARYDPCRRSRAARSCRARHRARGGAHRTPGVPVRSRISTPSSCTGAFRLIAAACRQAGLDLARDRIPVRPAAHYVMGGVETDLDGRTSIAGLFAAGEVACTGVHGANRLASNSLLEGLVFGARAGRAMREAPRAAGCQCATGGGLRRASHIAIGPRRPRAPGPGRDVARRRAVPRSRGPRTALAVSNPRGRTLRPTGADGANSITTAGAREHRDAGG